TYPNAAPGSMLGTSSLTAGTGGAAQTPGISAPGPLSPGTGGLPGGGGLGARNEPCGVPAARPSEAAGAPEARSPPRRAAYRVSAALEHATNQWVSLPQGPAKQQPRPKPASRAIPPPPVA